MDSKMRALQALVSMAEQQTTRLEAAIARAERLGIAECSNILAEIERVAETKATQPQNQLGKLPVTPTTSRESDHLLACQERIHHLAAQGLSVEAIAAETSATVGEVELMLRLPRQPQASQHSPAVGQGHAGPAS
jgi:hypothetical protein